MDNAIDNNLVIYGMTEFQNIIEQQKDSIKSL